MESRGLLEEDEERWHTTRISLPPDAQLHTLHTHHTFFVRLSGVGSRSVRPEAIMGALVARGHMPPDVATKQNIDWYMEEQTGNRCFVVKKGLDTVRPSTNGAEFYLESSGPNIATGSTVRVTVTHSSSKENTFRMEYIPYLADEDLVTFISSYFCTVVRANIDINRKDVWWVTTTTPLKDLPHWVVAENLVQDVPSSRLLISVKDRDVQCFYCRETLHWTNQCKLKKTIEKEERQMFVERKKKLREQQLKEAKARGLEEEANRKLKGEAKNLLNQERQGVHVHQPQGKTQPFTPSHPRKSPFYPDFTPDNQEDDNLNNAPCSSSSSSETQSYRQSPNSAQQSPDYSCPASPDTPPSAQPPKRQSKQNEVSWQQEVIDTLSPKTRKREIRDKLNRDLITFQRRKCELRDEEAEKREALEKKHQESRKKQLAIEEAQRNEVAKRKEDKEKARKKEIEDERAMSLASVTNKEAPSVANTKKRKKKARASFKAAKTTGKPPHAKALFVGTDAPEGKTGAPLDIVSHSVDSDRLKVADESIVECIDKGPTLTSTPRSMRPNAACTTKIDILTTPKAPAPFDYPQNTPDQQTTDAVQSTPGVLNPPTETSDDTHLRHDDEAKKKSLLEFYSSDPESGISKIINALPSSPKPGDKRAYDHSSSGHNDSKRPLPDNTSLDWENESLTLQADQNPNPVQSTEKNNNSSNPAINDEDDNLL